MVYISLKYLLWCAIEVRGVNHSCQCGSDILDHQEASPKLKLPKHPLEQTSSFIGVNPGVFGGSRPPPALPGGARAPRVGPGGSWGSQRSRWGSWGRGRVVKYYYSLSCTGSMFESGDF